MTIGFQSITQLISEADLGTLMDAARTAASRQELWDLTRDRLSAPSVNSRRNAWNVFRQWYLDGEIPKDEPAVLAWHTFSEAQVRREVLHIERCRHLGVVDGFLRDVLYPKLGHGLVSLFGEEAHELTSAEIDDYVSGHLPELSDRTRHVTRDKLRFLLVEAGLIQRSGTDFQGTWRYTYHSPTWQAWSYGLYRELGDNDHRQRAERFVIEDSLLTRRFLLRASDVSPLLAEGARRGVLGEEFFGGERYVRLLYEDAAALVRALGNQDAGEG